MNNIFLRYPRLQTVFSVLGAITFVWWCVFFPELCFPQDTYELVDETQEITETEEELCEKETCFELLDADDGQIVIKSRLLEWMSQEKD